MSEARALLADAVERLGGTARAGQQTMVEEVAATLDRGGHLLIQAGTGTGKSLGYLVPVMEHATRSAERAIVSTATLALQRQVLLSDAPRVADVVAARTGVRPKVALLKGWHNYLCKHKVAGGYPSEEEPALFPADAASADPTAPTATSGLSEQVLRLREWAQETTTGDRDDLAPGVSDRAWRQVSVTKLECLGRHCPMLAECFPEAARQAAHEADVVVTNHAMLGIAASGSPNVLPEHDVLVVDEAHELAERVTAQATLEFSASAVERTARLARRHAGVASQALADAAAALRASLEELPEGRLPDGLPAAVAAAVTLVEAGSREALSAMAGSKDGEEAGGRLMARSAMLELHEASQRLLGDGVAQRREVAWCERPFGGEQTRLRLAPLDVAGPIATHLLEGRATVMTSATLALGGSFEPMARSLGLTILASSEDAGTWRGVDVGSPFDYRRQGILYIARHLPPPGRNGLSDEALAELVELVRAAGGATLGLFSSRRGAERAAEVLRAEVETPVLCQGEDQLPALVRAFTHDEATTLVGTLSLWQGVDVPGRTCRLVVIDRIPFPRPDDPVTQARAEVVSAAGGNGFMSVSATHAALLLAQGAGRLVRSKEDRGVVAVLDPRLATARYGPFLARSLPSFWRSENGTVVKDALRRLAAGQPAPAR